MPAQALVTHHTKAEVQKMITEGGKGLLSIADGPDDKTFLVVCEMDGLKHKEGASAALQKIADADSARVREAQALAEKKAEEKEAATKAE